MGNTEGKIERNFDPRNDSGVEIPGWPQGHNTPALILAVRGGIESIQQVKYNGNEILSSLRSGERIVCATGNRGDHEVPTCTNGVTIATLSRPETQ